MDPVTRLLMQGAAGAGGEVLGIEDVFSTWLYTGNGSTQTITNGIDLAGEGGLVWTKGRDLRNHIWIDTARGATKQILSNSDQAEQTFSTTLTQFNSDGYALSTAGTVNASSINFASWTFRKAEKFFDVVTWTGNGTSGRAIPHNLGSAPGFIAVKILSASDNWECYHRGVTFNSGNVLWLNSANALTTGGPRFTSVPDATNFYLGSDSGVNGSGATYVAYLFAHDAGGFGDDGTESVIKCGSYTGNGTTGQEISLGWEPQWLLIKRTNDIADWAVIDTMRGLSLTDTRWVFANASSAEAGASFVGPTSTGFSLRTGDSLLNLSGSTYIYIAIRRGPMKTPTDATKVYTSSLGNSSATIPAFSSAFVVDAALYARPSISADNRLFARLTGNKYMATVSTNGESSDTWGLFDSNAGWGLNYDTDYRSWMFRRAPGFFDVVVYAGTGVARTVSHNLGVVPELMIVKCRNVAGRSWFVYSAAVGNGSSLTLQTSDASSSGTAWDNTTPTSSVFSIGGGASINGSGDTFIAYLFATCPGVSKVGSYTGTGTTLNVDCGFASGARFVLIKRTDSTGDWYVWDTARGIVSGNDPYLLLNSTAAEVTSTDYIDPLSSGFQISSTAPAAINASGGSFIFLAIA